MDNMKNKLLAFFEPALTIRWRGLKQKQRAFYYPNRTRDEQILRQFMEEAGLSTRDGVKITEDQYDAVLTAASKHGYSIVTIGSPDDN